MGRWQEGGKEDEEEAGGTKYVVSTAWQGREELEEGVMLRILIN
jgi:hypothetical protein